MTSFAALVLVVLVVVTRLDEVDSLECVECNSTSVDNCSSANRTCNGTVCRRFTGLLNGETNITILDCGAVNASSSTGCSSDVYIDAYGQQFSGRSCYCNSTDFCANLDAVLPPTPTAAAAAVETSSTPPAVTPNNTSTVSSSVRPPPGLPWGWLTGPFGVGPAVFTCYKCSSRQDVYCGAHLDKSGYTTTCTGGACLTYSGKVDGNTVTSRDCAQNVPPGDRDCITKSEDWGGYKFEGTFCLCRSDYCNEFIRSSLSTSLRGGCSRLLLLLVVAYLTTVCSAALTKPLMGL